jgi:hypothetical protein
MRLASILLLSFVLSSATAPMLAAQPAPEHGQSTVRNDKHGAAPRHPRAEPQGPIACSKGGCRRIPANCHPEPGFDPRGNPTGYDVAVCR